MSEENKGNNLL